jgi:hypothetical protein
MGNAVGSVHKLCAAIASEARDEALLLPIRNISAGGALLVTDGQDASLLRAGRVYEIVVFALDDPPKQAAASARIMRNTSDSVSVLFSDEDGSIWRIADLLMRVQRA